MRQNARNTSFFTLRLFIKGMAPRFMPKCWVNFVMRSFMVSIYLDIKRLNHVPYVTNCRHSSFMQDMQRSIYSMPNFQTNIYKILFGIARNTNNTFSISHLSSSNNPNLFTCDILPSKLHSFSCFRGCFTTWSVEKVRLDIFPKLPGTHIARRRR